MLRVQVLRADTPLQRPAIVFMVVLGPFRKGGQGAGEAVAQPVPVLSLPSDYS